MVGQGSWTAVEVTRAFCHRAAIAHQLLNCLHEVFFEAAIHDAEQLDKYFATHKKTTGPLHGLPVSLKDQFHVRGVQTTMGYVGWIGTFQGVKGSGKELVFESEMVRELRNLGAVLYCKTAVPHTLMSGESMNNIIDYVWNPKNRDLSAGGSSGGEGALIGFKGSPIGFGTDIGGSIRIPAASNGLYGIRPSVGRLPYEGMANSFDGQNTILSVVGPLATTARSLKLVVQALLSQQPWLYDPLALELPWRDEQEQQVLDAVAGKSKLAFGYLKHDGVVTPTPPVRRAMEIVLQTVRRLGHDVIEWNPPSHAYIDELCFKTWTYDGGTDARAAFALSGEPMSPQIKLFEEVRPEVTATAIAETNVARRNVTKAYMDYWNKTAALTSTGRPVDAVVCPLAPFAAARREKYAYYGYSSWVNLVDWTAVVLPVTQADKNLDKVDAKYQPISEVDAACYESYDPDIYDGAHVSVQLVGRRLQEEKMIALAEYIGNAVQNA